MYVSACELQQKSAFRIKLSVNTHKNLVSVEPYLQKNIL